jgi:hypothetical protein
MGQGLCYVLAWQGRQDKISASRPLWLRPIGEGDQELEKWLVQEELT